MFEKETEEHCNKAICSLCEITCHAKCHDWQDEYDVFQKGAEFGYNIAKEEIDYLNKHWRNEEESKANEWHYCKDKLPEIKVGNCVDVEVCFLNAFDNPCKKSCYWNGKDFLYWSDKKPIGEKKVSLFGKIYAWKYEDKLPEIPKEFE